FGDKPYLECQDVVDGELWRNAFDDKLFSGWRRLEWCELRIKGVDIVQHWPDTHQRTAHPKSNLKQDIEAAFQNSPRPARSSKSRPVASAVSAALEQHGLKKQRPQNRTYAQIATLIAPAYSKICKRPVESANEQEALEKAIARHYRTLAKDGT